MALDEGLTSAVAVPIEAVKVAEVVAASVVAGVTLEEGLPDTLLDTTDAVGLSDAAAELVIGLAEAVTEDSGDPVIGLGEGAGDGVAVPFPDCEADADTEGRGVPVPLLDPLRDGRAEPE